MKQTVLKRKTPLRAKKGLERKERKNLHSYGGGRRLPKRTMRKRRKVATPQEKVHLDAVAKLGCIIARLLSHGRIPASLHHIRTGYGTSERASHWEVIPLAPLRHKDGGMGYAFHDGPRTFQAKFGTEVALLKLVYDLLGIPFEKLPELRGSEPPWWPQYLDGSALVSPASVIFDVEEEDE